MEKEMDSSSVKIRAVASIIVAIIIAIGVIISAVILSRGDYGGMANQCITVGGRDQEKAMESSMAMNIEMMDSGREVGKQMMRYNYDSNTILVETANISGFSRANVVIDYDRAIVMIEVQGVCLASSLHGDMMNMADRITGYMRTDQEVIDIASVRIVNLNYERIGVIPAGYVTLSNGPIIRGLCAGDESYWTEQTGMTDQGGRKRRSASGSVRICIFGFCFNISF
ncbi:uncharacterized protein LOC121427545 [Lytechinus variegatus]|uniref:uncharacterized protein LOC121427545 n=1 Tax=Lytechinus variegatus TaxID=7654 RepID=UPI001BB1F417|nr:uncharacterized protein LOC121427545 [Lytechinus variegatus]